MSKFGTVEFFKNFMIRAIKEEKGGADTVNRITFAMSSLILETHKGKEALDFLKNLNEAGEFVHRTLSRYV